MRDEGPANKRVKAIVCEARGAAERQAVRDAGGEAASAARATNLRSLYIPAKLRRIDGEGNFLLYDKEAGSDRILISGTQPNVAFLRHSPNWSADGASRTPPRTWQRPYSLHASESEFNAPRLFGLFPNKAEGTYRRFRMAALNLFGRERPPPATMLTDFEPGASRNDVVRFATSTLAKQLTETWRGWAGIENQEQRWWQF